MTLVDTSVWVDHLRSGDRRLAGMLERGEVACHALIIGELACGTLRNRALVLSLLHALPSALRATDAEALALVEHHELMGRGIGIVAVHLLASALLGGLDLWTRDRRLASVATALGIDAA